MPQNKNLWSGEVTEEEKYHTPEDTFTKKAPEIVKILMAGAKNDTTLALRRLLFYMNRAGSKLTNSVELEKAKAKLEELEKE